MIYECIVSMRIPDYIILAQYLIPYAFWAPCIMCMFLMAQYIVCIVIIIDKSDYSALCDN